MSQNITQIKLLNIKLFRNECQRCRSPPPQLQRRTPTKKKAVMFFFWYIFFKFPWFYFGNLKLSIRNINQCKIMFKSNESLILCNGNCLKFTNNESKLKKCFSFLSLTDQNGSKIPIIQKSQSPLILGRFLFIW